jgi:hypothetical protein
LHGRDRRLGILEICRGCTGGWLVPLEPPLHPKTERQRSVTRNKEIQEAEGLPNPKRHSEARELTDSPLGCTTR